LSSGTIIAASAAVFRDGKVLIARRVNPPALWSLPGGRVEKNEDPKDAAERELYEETGVEAEILGLAGQREVMLRDERGEIVEKYVVMAFAARWLAGEAKAGPEASAVAWVEPDKLTGYEMTEGLIPIILAAQRIVQI
jgi:8-oxo-dGTP diphosphatase